MPTGTGKTICILSLIVAYISAKPENVKRVTSRLKEMTFLADLLHAHSGWVREDDRRIKKTFAMSIEGVDRLRRKHSGSGPKLKV